MSFHILFVEDALDVQLVVADLLRGNGYEVDVASSGSEGIRQQNSARYDLLILDVMLPEGDGLSLCRQVRERGFDGPVLMLTALTQVEDRVAGLSAGADDYLMKPFDPRELLARIAALLRRAGKTPLTPVQQFHFSDVYVDFERREVFRNKKSVSLAAKEMSLLKHLIDHRGQVLSRTHLLAHVWADQTFISPRTVDVHIAWLRQKLEKNSQAPRHILTVRGEGYSFVP